MREMTNPALPSSYTLSFKEGKHRQRKCNEKCRVITALEIKMSGHLRKTHNVTLDGIDPKHSLSLPGRE